MAKFEIVLTLIIIGLVLFLIGLWLHHKEKKLLFISTAGALLLLITGLLLLVQEPILFKSGQTITINNSLVDNVTTTTEAFVYAAQNSNLNTILSWVLMLLGLAGAIGTSVSVYNSRFDDLEE